MRSERAVSVTAMPTRPPAHFWWRLKAMCLWSRIAYERKMRVAAKAIGLPSRGVNGFVFLTLLSVSDTKRAADGDRAA